MTKAIANVGLREMPARQWTKAQLLAFSTRSENRQSYERDELSTVRRERTGHDRFIRICRTFRCCYLVQRSTDRVGDDSLTCRSATALNELRAKVVLSCCWSENNMTRTKGADLPKNSKALSKWGRSFSAGVSLTGIRRKFSSSMKSGLGPPTLRFSTYSI